MKKYIYSIVFMLLTALTSAQQATVQQVTKTINKTFEVDAKNSLNVVGERAEIFIDVHAKNEIEVSLAIVAKHPDRSTAERELKAMIFKSEAIGKQIYLRNYIETEAGQKPKASLKAVYSIKLPTNCPITVSNYFGEVVISGLSASLNLTSDFSRVSISNYKGKAVLQTKYGSIKLTDISGDFKLSSNRTNMELKNISGNYTIDAAVAKISVNQMEEINEFNLSAKKCQVDLKQLDTEKLQLDFELEKVNLQKASTMELDFIKGENGKSIIKHNKTSKLPVVKIQLQTGSLSIN